MPNSLPNAFCWIDECCPAPQATDDRAAYQSLVDWSLKARSQNPTAFDAVIRWLLDDSQWTADLLSANRELLLEQIVGRFRRQNALLRARLKALEASGLVNGASLPALDRFDDALTGEELSAPVFNDFSALLNRDVRERFAGCPSGAAGTDTISRFGYLNLLKDCDANVQWTLFMPQVVESQQKGFRVTRFEYKTLPAMRLIGFEGEEYEDPQLRMRKMQELDALEEYRFGIAHDVLFMHHYGLGVDVGPWHGIWGRFMKAGTPVPEGFIHFDFVPEPDNADGPPYVSQFACAQFEGSPEALHAREGFDSDAMYDVTRNIILSQSVCIPYPSKYWTAEVFPNGCIQPGNTYLFSALPAFQP